MINDCGWCNGLIKGKKSNLYGLCSDCRKSDEGKKYVKKIDKEIELLNEKNLKKTRLSIPTYEEFKKGKKLKRF